ncbi:hypothetical protein HDU76_004557, partial [Blyttiomyces sp. JEL0837]
MKNMEDHHLQRIEDLEEGHKYRFDQLRKHIQKQRQQIEELQKRSSVGDTPHCKSIISTERETSTGEPQIPNPSQTDTTTFKASDISNSASTSNADLPSKTALPGNFVSIAPLARLGLPVKDAKSTTTVFQDTLTPLETTTSDDQKVQLPTTTTINFNSEISTVLNVVEPTAKDSIRTTTTDGPLAKTETRETGSERRDFRQSKFINDQTHKTHHHNSNHHGQDNGHGRRYNQPPQANQGRPQQPANNNNNKKYQRDEAGAPHHQQNNGESNHNTNRLHRDNNRVNNGDHQRANNNNNNRYNNNNQKQGSQKDHSNNHNGNNRTNNFRRQAEHNQPNHQHNNNNPTSDPLATQKNVPILDRLGPRVQSENAAIELSGNRKSILDRLGPRVESEVVVTLPAQNVKSSLTVLVPVSGQNAKSILDRLGPRVNETSVSEFNNAVDFKIPPLPSFNVSSPGLVAPVNNKIVGAATNKINKNVSPVFDSSFFSCLNPPAPAPAAA